MCVFVCLFLKKGNKFLMFKMLKIYFYDEYQYKKKCINDFVSTLRFRSLNTSLGESHTLGKSVIWLDKIRKFDLKKTVSSLAKCIKLA